MWPFLGLLSCPTPYAFLQDSSSKGDSFSAESGLFWCDRVTCLGSKKFFECTLNTENRLFAMQGLFAEKWELMQC